MAGLLIPGDVKASLLVETGSSQGRLSGHGNLERSTYRLRASDTQIYWKDGAQHAYIHPPGFGNPVRSEPCKRGGN